MPTIKRVSGNLEIVTLGPTSNINMYTGTLNVSGNIQSTNLLVSNVVSFPTANITANNITSNTITSVGNFVTTGTFIGDGSGLTNIPAGNASANRIQNGTSKVDLPNLSGNIQMDVAGVANVLLADIAYVPNALLLLPVVLDNNALAPLAVFSTPVVFENNTSPPTTVLYINMLMTVTAINGLISQVLPPRLQQLPLWQTQ